MKQSLTIRWAVNVHDQGRIKQLPGISQHPLQRLPEEGETITHPFLVDPATNEPIPLIVDQVLMHTARPDERVVVVSRHQ